MTEDIARSVVSISTNTVTLGAGGTSIGHGLYLIDSSVHVFRDVPLVGSSNPLGQTIPKVCSVFSLWNVNIFVRRLLRAVVVQEMRIGSIRILA